MNLSDVTVFNDLRERLAQITPEQVEASGRRIKQETTKRSKVVGVIELQATRALYALWMLFEAESALELAKAKGSTDEDIEKDHLQRASLLDTLGDVAKEVFWAQARMDLGFHEFCSIGIRSGWKLVKEPHEAGPAAMFAQLLHGPMPPEE